MNGVKIFIIFLILHISVFLFSESLASEKDKSISDMLSHIPCEAQVSDILTKWGRSYKWKQGIKYQNVSSIKSPLEKIGYWVHLRVKGEVSQLLRQTPNMDLIVFLETAKNCTPKMERIKKQHSAESNSHFTDDFFEQILKESKKKKKSGIIYVWSLGMTLSISWG